MKVKAIIVALASMVWLSGAASAATVSVGADVDRSLVMPFVAVAGERVAGEVVLNGRVVLAEGVYRADRGPVRPYAGIMAVAAPSEGVAVAGPVVGLSSELSVTGALSIVGRIGLSYVGSAGLQAPWSVALRVAAGPVGAEVGMRGYRLTDRIGRIGLRVQF